MNWYIDVVGHGRHVRCTRSWRKNIDVLREEWSWTWTWVNNGRWDVWAISIGRAATTYPTSHVWDRHGRYAANSHMTIAVHGLLILRQCGPGYGLLAYYTGSRLGVRVYLVQISARTIYVTSLIYTRKHRKGKPPFVSPFKRQTYSTLTWSSVPALH